MYAWKCWRETRSSFIFLLTLFTATAVLMTLAPGLGERNGWWHFDRGEYLHNPGPTGQMVSVMVFSSLWACGLLSAVFFGATASGSEIEPGTIEYLWTRPRTRASVTWAHWCVCLAEMLVVTIVPIYLAMALLGTLTRHWNSSGLVISELLMAPWLMVIVSLPLLGLTTLMTAWRRSAKSGLLLTAAVVTVYIVVRQIATGPLHLQLPPLFAGPMVWLTNNNVYGLPPNAFPWGSLGRAVFLAAAFPLAAQYLLKRAEV
jgi:ABC-type transport system involved in multi-copper enzyme maturation permease subunit